MTKQEYLQDLRVAVVNFSQAANHLANILQNSKYAEPNEHIQENYPFAERFLEVVENIRLWETSVKTSVRNHLNNHKHEM